MQIDYECIVNALYSILSQFNVITGRYSIYSKAE